MSTTAALAALAFAALQMFVAGLALQDTLGRGLLDAGGSAAAEVAHLHR